LVARGPGQAMLSLAGDGGHLATVIHWVHVQLSEVSIKAEGGRVQKVDRVAASASAAASTLALAAAMRLQSPVVGIILVGGHGREEEGGEAEKLHLCCSRFQK
jgi:hypothetical protein